MCLVAPVSYISYPTYTISHNRVRNVWFDELDYLEQQLVEKNIDMANAWKVLTLFIGANDLCVACKMQKRFDSTEFGEYYRRVMTEIRDRFPRTLVNVVELFNVSAIYRATENEAFCNEVHRLVFIECDCAFGPESVTKPYRDMMDQMAQSYNQQIRAVVKEFSVERNDSFAIALHSFTRELNVTSFPMVRFFRFASPSLFLYPPTHTADLPYPHRT